jgi:hypothetical protein
LPTAGGALKEVSALNQAMGLSATRGAFEPVWPSKLDDSRAALVLGSVLVLEGGFAEAFLELHHIASHRISFSAWNVHGLYHTKSG